MTTKSKLKPSKDGEKYKSGAQITVSAFGEGKITPPTPPNQSDYAAMMRHPTMKLAIRVVMALAMKEPWSIVGPDAEYCAKVASQLDLHRKRILRSAIIGFIKRGWAAFEIKYRLEEGIIAFDGVKSLRADKTFQVIDKTTGEFMGLAVKASAGAADDVMIDADHSLFVNQDDDGFGEYGDADLATGHEAWVKWGKCDDGAQRYDEKVAGGFLLLKYPVGKTPYRQNNGEETPNDVIAEDILKKMVSSGKAAIPVRVIDDVSGKELPKIHDAWTLEHVSGSGSGLQPSFILRGKYLDGLMMRTFGLPERTATEGSLGTKAEAEAHADVALLVNHERHELVAEAINEQLLRAINNANVGDPKAARLDVGELDAQSRELFSKVFVALMQDPILGDKIGAMVDESALLDKLQVPVRDPSQVRSETTPFNNE